METTEHIKEISASGTGMESGLTILGKAVNGVKKQAEIIAIRMNLRSKHVEIEYEVFLHDNKGNRIEGIDPVNKFFYIKDSGEKGTVEMDPISFDKKLETFKKVTDEDLALTDWNNFITPQGATLGQVTIGGAVAFVTQLENIIQ